MIRSHRILLEVRDMNPWWALQDRLPSLAAMTRAASHLAPLRRHLLRQLCCLKLAAPLKLVLAPSFSSFCSSSRARRFPTGTRAPRRRYHQSHQLGASWSLIPRATDKVAKTLYSQCASTASNRPDVRLRCQPLHTHPFQVSLPPRSSRSRSFDHQILPGTDHQKLYPISRPQASYHQWSNQLEDRVSCFDSSANRCTPNLRRKRGHKIHL
mmetsp:Transcript_6137/g.11339  ORF Transcript_6137/g.11339 Transcript_6137/m.11339 type:complete len:211 (-) Transcript_6137:348-980(-)